MYKYVYVCMYVCMYVCVFVCVCVYIYIHTHTYMYIWRTVGQGPAYSLEARGKDATSTLVDSYRKGTMSS